MKNNEVKPKSEATGCRRMGRGAYTGSTVKGNPFRGLDRVIAYDRYESSFPVVEQDEGKPVISTPYRSGAKMLVRHFSANEGQLIADLGSGTGICTLELFASYPEISVLGMEELAEMIRIARHKFNQSTDHDLLDMVTNTRLLEYWQGFRAESAPFRGRVKFLQAEVVTTDAVTPESLDGAVANQFMHWNDLSKTFRQLFRLLKNRCSVVWNSASHFYNDKKFPAEKWGFRYNSFFATVMEIVSKTAEVDDYLRLSLPEHDIGSIKAITSEEGFDTRQVGTYLLPVDLQTFVKNHVPTFVRELVVSDIGDEEKDALAREAVAKIMSDPVTYKDALDDVTHKYDIVPIFESRKK